MSWRSWFARPEPAAAPTPAAPRTAFLGAYGYGNLGDELCLIEAMQAFPGEDAHALSVDADWTRRCVPALTGCFATGEALLALNPSRIVFGGGMVGVTSALRTWLPWMARAERQGAEVHFHNLGVGRLKEVEAWLDEAARGVIERLGTFTVRDHLAVEYFAEAGIARLPAITHFPECNIAPDPALADRLLPQGMPLLGLSIIPTPMMKACLELEAPRIRALLAEFAGHAVVPIVSTVHRYSSEEDDLAGVTQFLHDFLPEGRIAAPQLLDRSFWHQELTPRRLKGIIGRLDTLITQRKHNAVHAIGSGVRVIGLHPLEDNSLRRTFIALQHRLRPGSRCIGLLPTSWRAA
ncbi:polysaccharide pyruvyl transferase family protein [Falsiroseomonas tokyonensis]|uniref:Polysaccharide pyruvyl transferase family protein n=1 Tax=Falsiroseomonas tokyonensis TaxID=430521 RepID=A0ABV7BS56_9PROT|nr:polysaccharide pyruvyl transferase family protein [Falsiroseomonas tokyonensis]MBU8536918.1 polysaccharide pyruvyl transferase family protein [Falsiroseomonas tokyonensis]